MKKILINKRDEMVVVYLDNLAYLLADGSYTKIVYIGGMQTTLAIGISDMEKSSPMPSPKSLRRSSALAVV